MSEYGPTLHGGARADDIRTQVDADGDLNLFQKGITKQEDTVILDIAQQKQLLAYLAEKHGYVPGPMGKEAW